jgi:hypothetical protein
VNFIFNIINILIMEIKGNAERAEQISMDSLAEIVGVVAIPPPIDGNGSVLGVHK